MEKNDHMKFLPEGVRDTSYITESGEAKTDVTNMLDAFYSWAIQKRAFVVSEEDFCGTITCDNVIQAYIMSQITQAYPGKIFNVFGNNLKDQDIPRYLKDDGVYSTCGIIHSALRGNILFPVTSDSRLEKQEPEKISDVIEREIINGSTEPCMICAVCGIECNSPVECREFLFSPPKTSLVNNLGEEIVCILL